jgi:hypothetical protein
MTTVAVDMVIIMTHFMYILTLMGQGLVMVSKYQMVMVLITLRVIGVGLMEILAVL